MPYRSGDTNGDSGLAVAITMSYSNPFINMNKKNCLLDLRGKTQLILSQVEQWRSVGILLPSVADSLRREADNLLSRCDSRVSDSDLAQLIKDVGSFSESAARYLNDSVLARSHGGHIMPPQDLAAYLNSPPQASSSTPVQQPPAHVIPASPPYVANAALHPPPKRGRGDAAAIHPTQPAVGGGPAAIPNPPFNQFNVQGNLTPGSWHGSNAPLNAHGNPTPGWGGSNAPLNVHGNPTPGSWHGLNTPPNAHGNPAPGSWRGSNAPPNAHSNPTPGSWHGWYPPPNQFDAHGNPTPGFWHEAGNTSHGGSHMPPSGNNGSSA
ncbi:hypothetical protein EW146_g4338 [Bondarzewia mesenterica]|uniref:Uncharacterized protein n=1 Tax=Bondarzewia mesenterica TaxID=1095465 RepID=A0A4S4M0M2_9AGAM|nr:hypothetical protein EW146_g4338 [Bondarzewia mesenterica]